MNLALTITRSTFGIHAKTVSVEIHLSNGLPKFTIVGLAETAVKESKDRVRSAIINSRFEFPCRRITVNLAPADLPKTGPGFDLPIALGILAASGQISVEKIQGYEFIGELALSGELRGISGIIPVILAARNDKHTLIMPFENAVDAAVIGDAEVYTANCLREVVHFFKSGRALARVAQYPEITVTPPSSIDWSDVKGQQYAKQAMVIAATGGHSILLSGPPGSGKTMLAKRFATLLPLLSEKAALECAAINSIRGQLPDYQTWKNPPFRAPHHTASPVALVGGGNPPKPGEITLAHHGVLFLDELPEYNRVVLETLREPLESGQICISRAAVQTEFPAEFQLIAAMNPCPCGQWGNNKANCLCSPDRITRYLSKISGPILDRIDMQIWLQPLSEQDLIQANPAKDGESSRLRAQISKMRDRQLTRQNCINAKLSVKACESVCELGENEKAFLTTALAKLRLSARGYHRLLKVARTIADLKEEDRVNLLALQQALSYKQSIELPR